MPRVARLASATGPPLEILRLLHVFVQRQRPPRMPGVHIMSVRIEECRAEGLLQHASCIRELALKLVRDPWAAEDLVQDTWAAALAHRPAADRSLRPWLGTVLRNFARRAHRRAAARPTAEESAVATARGADPADVCEGIEAAQLLSEELAQLEEPYRTVLFLRFYRDLTPIEIARQLGTPPATVRSRLKRGIERLRERLDGRFGRNRGSWCALLTPLIRSKATLATSVAAGTAATTGLLAMNVLLKTAVALAAIVVAYLGLAFIGVLPDTLELTTRAGEADVATLAAVADDTSSKVASLPSEPEPVAERRNAELAVPPDREENSASPQVETCVEAVIVDKAGNAVVGAKLRAVRRGDPPPSVASDGGGFARLELELDEQRTELILEASATGFASVVERVALERGETVDLGTLVLPPGGSISGVVVDERDRRVAGARVTAETTGRAAIDLESERYGRTEARVYARPAVPQALTDANGSFILEGLNEEHVRLWVDAAGMISAFSPSIEVRAARDSDGVEVVMQSIRRENSVQGIVIDPTGEPIPFALLDYLHEERDLHTSYKTSVTAEEDGSFTFVLGAGAVLSITARDPQDRYGLASIEGLEAGVTGLVLRLTDSAQIGLVALGKGGETLEDYSFHILAANGGVEPLQSGQSESGVASFRLPEVEFVVRATAPFHRIEIVGPLTPATTPNPLTVRLTPVPGIVGQVLARGEPVPGARVRLHRTVSDEVRYEDAGLRCWLVPDPLDERDADGEGRFVLSARAEGEYVVQVEQDGFAIAEWGPFSLGPALRCDPLLIELGAGGTVEGRITLANDGDPSGTIVDANRGDGSPLAARVGSDGMYSFEHLTPGDWNVSVRDERRQRRNSSTSPAVTRFEDEVPWNCVVVEGQLTYHDLTVADQNTFVLKGRISVEGIPAPSLTACVYREGANFYSSRGRIDSAAPDAEGRFELGLAEAGQYQLVVMYFGKGGGWLITDEIAVGPELEPWSLELETGSLEIEGVDPATFDTDIPPFGYLWNGPGDLYFMCLPMPTSDGCILNPLPVGKGALVRPRAEAILDPSKWEVAQEVEIRRGEMVRVDSP